MWGSIRSRPSTAAPSWRCRRCRSGLRPPRSNRTNWKNSTSSSDLSRRRRRACRSPDSALIPLHAAGVSPVDNPAVAAAEFRDLAHIVVAQRKIEDCGVFGKPFHFAGPRDDDDILLHQKAQADLGRGLAVGGADALENVAFARLTLRDRTVRNDG